MKYLKTRCASGVPYAVILGRKVLWLQNQESVFALHGWRKRCTSGVP